MSVFSEEARSLALDVTSMLAKAGFTLTKWLSNKKEVLADFLCDQCSELVQQLPSEGVKERVLGVEWDVKEDKLQVKVEILPRPITRRGILSTIHSMFDPLGFLAPVTIEAKLLMRRLNDYDWDVPMSPEEVECWSKWVSSLSLLEHMSVPRCLNPTTYEEVQYDLHHFAEAFQVAYGGVSYLRVSDKDSNVYCFMLIGKRFVAPPGITIPPLELQAAVTAVSLDKFLRKELMLPIENSLFWLDSMAVLKSIYNSKKKFPMYVANRLAEIERSSCIENWRYVPIKINPADEVSRGVSANKFVKRSQWLTGPDFIWKSVKDWPDQLAVFAHKKA